jgi:general secretion pathway protein G
MRSSRHSQNGITCIEIMVGILVVGLLATIVIQSLRGASDKAKRTKARDDIAELKKALDRYYLDNGYYPTTDQGLRALVTPPTNGFLPLVYYSGGYLERLPKDPWGESLLLPKRWEFVRPEVAWARRHRKRGRYRRQPVAMIA